jgi:hypothetical protein
MLKDLMTIGTLSQIALSKMSAVVDGAQLTSLCLTEIVNSWLNTSKNKNLFQVDVTSTTQGERPSITIIVTCYEQKKTPEKNGAT